MVGEMGYEGNLERGVETTQKKRLEGIMGKGKNRSKNTAAWKTPAYVENFEWSGEVTERDLDMRMEWRRDLNGQGLPMLFF